MALAINETELIDLLATLEQKRPTNSTYTVSAETMSLIKRNLRLLARIEAAGYKRANFPAEPFAGAGSFKGAS